jgi:hypothetical protein
MAAKHFKLLTDVIQTVDTKELNARLERGRARYAKMLAETDSTVIRRSRTPE